MSFSPIRKYCTTIIKHVSSAGVSCVLSVSRHRCSCLGLGSVSTLVMVALWNRADYYIFILSFVLLLSSFLLSSPNLSLVKQQYLLHMSS